MGGTEGPGRERKHSSEINLAANGFELPRCPVNLAAPRRTGPVPPRLRASPAAARHRAAEGANLAAREPRDVLRWRWSETSGKGECLMSPGRDLPSFEESLER